MIQAFYNFLEYITVSFDSGDISFIAQKNNDQIEIKIKVNANKILFKYKTKLNDNENNSLFITELNDFRQFIIEQLIKKQGGQFKVEKLDNRLLTFTISLPGLSYESYYRNDSDITAPAGIESFSSEKKQKKEVKEKKKSILIIGEKTGDIEFLQNFLKAEDYRIKFKYLKDNIKIKLNNDFSLLLLHLFVVHYLLYKCKCSKMSLQRQKPITCRF